jgi:hypothetical protein
VDVLAVLPTSAMRPPKGELESLAERYS